MSEAESHYSRSEDTLLATDLELPPSSYLLPGTLAGLLIGLWLFLPAGVAPRWAISDASFSQRWSVLVLHIFVHGGLIHVLMNAAALVVVGPRLIARIGTPAIAWARFIYVFVGSGIAGAAAFLLLDVGPHPSALGASGAIFGLIGALARVQPATGSAASLLSRRSWLLVRMFAIDHAVLFALILGTLLLTGQSAMIAWEAHLGGMLFGLFLAPLFLPRAGIQANRPSQ